MLGGVHGDDEASVYAELCRVVEEWILIHARDGMPLPPATASADGGTGISHNPVQFGDDP